MTASTSPKVRFGPFVLDPSSGELSRDGVRVPLQEHPFRVLRLLVERPGQVITRDELVGALWPGTTFIDTDVGLNTAVRKLRSALDDDSDSPRYIETLPRRGYRLCVPVEADARPTPASVKAVGGRRWVWGVAVLVACVGLLWWWTEAPEDTPVASAARAGGPPVLVLLPFEVPTRDDPIRARVDGIAESLRQGLGSMPGLRVSTSGQARTTMPNTAPDVRELHADIALGGEVRGSGANRQLRLRLQKPGAPRPEWSQEYSLATRDLALNVAKMQNDIALRVLRDPETAALHTQLTALETGALMRAGNRAYEQGTRVEDWNDAIVHFEQALRRDPDNPRAWCRLSRLYMQWIWVGQKTTEAALAKALPAIERGKKVEPGLSDCLMAQAEAAVVQGKVEEGRVFLHRTLEANPHEVEAQEALSNYAVFDGHIRRGLRGLERIVEEHPDGMYTWARVAWTRQMTGDRVGADAALRLMRDAWPDLAITHRAAGVVAELRNDHAGAMRFHEAAAAADPANGLFGASAAIAALEIDASDAAASAIERLRDSEAVADPKMWWFLGRGEASKAVAWARTRRASHATGSTAWGTMAQALALSGEHEEALAELRRWDEERKARNGPLLAGWHHILRRMEPEQLAALLPPGSSERMRLIEELRAWDARYRQEGADFTLLDYRAAVHAALSGKTEEAMRLLDVAIDHGYASSFSLRRDLVWIALRDDPRFQQRQARLDAIAAAQRQRLVADSER
jgi:DNA-binding winged helix-turn-helix (wHTH) protein/tetratricopeptide (TPR) repeat protein